LHASTGSIAFQGHDIIGRSADQRALRHRLHTGGPRCLSRAVRTREPARWRDRGQPLREARLRQSLRFLPVLEERSRRRARPALGGQQ
jgi:hypothetical protein